MYATALDPPFQSTVLDDGRRYKSLLEVEPTVVLLLMHKILYPSKRIISEQPVKAMEDVGSEDSPWLITDMMLPPGEENTIETEQFCLL